MALLERSFDLAALVRGGHVSTFAINTESSTVHRLAITTGLRKTSQATLQQRTL